MALENFFDTVLNLYIKDNKLGDMKPADIKASRIFFGSVEDVPKYAHNKYLATVFEKVVELKVAVNYLTFAEDLVRLESPRGIRHSDYLAYHFYAYTSSFYATHNRVISLLNYLSKNSPKLSIKIKEIKDRYEDSIRPILKARGYYTHKEYFFPEKLSRLEALELITKSANRSKKYKQLVPVLQNAIKMFNLDAEKEVVRLISETNSSVSKNYGWLFGKINALDLKFN